VRDNGLKDAFSIFRSLDRERRKRNDNYLPGNREKMTECGIISRKTEKSVRSEVSTAVNIREFSV
jgi:hypothetical protein